MKILSPLPRRRARIEIIPLIDIMFFLLAAFVLASLTLMRLQTVQLNLPRAALHGAGAPRGALHIAVDRAGDLTVDGQPMNFLALRGFLAEEFRRQPDVPVSINGDRAAAHGHVLRVLEAARNAGFDRVQFGVLPPEAAAPE